MREFSDVFLLVKVLQLNFSTGWVVFGMTCMSHPLESFILYFKCDVTTQVPLERGRQS